jgi:hypothetical protein
MARRPQMSQPVKKTTQEQRKASTSVATPAIHTVSKIVELLKPWELSERGGQKWKTYQMMLQDEAITSATDSRITAIEVAQSKPKFQYNKNSEKSTFIRDYLEYCLNTMQKSTRQLGRDCAEMVYNGISAHEVVAKIDNTSSMFNGMFVLDNLTYIDPLTLDHVKPFVTKNGGREIIAWRQKLTAFRDTNGELGNTTNLNTGAVEIDARKIVTSSYSASSSRILGSSVFDSIYTPWREKQLLSELLLAGCSKDLSGTPILRVPISLLDQAKDPNSEAYATVNQLTEHMTNLHQGDSTFMILPSSLTEGSSSIPDYDISFKGVEGSGKQFDMVTIIESKRRAIFNVLGASHLITGENGGGSYNLYAGAASTAAHYSKRDNLIIEDMWNKQIIPILLRLNNIVIEDESDRVVYKSGDIQPLSADEQGKFAQRVASVGMMPLVPETVNHFLEVMGSTYRVDENMSTEELREIMTNFDSSAGEGDGTSGTGDSQMSGAGSNLNNENAS